MKCSYGVLENFLKNFLVSRQEEKNIFLYFFTEF